MNLGNNMLKGAVWSFIERIGIQAVSFVLGLVLARLLTPEEYGVVGLLIVFVTISQVFIDSGFAKALIHKQDRTGSDVTTVFSFNIIISVLCYAILFFSAPFISTFYKLPELTSLLRVLAISLIFNALFTIHTTLLTIDMNFKTLAKVNFIATLASGLTAIYFAYVGYGAWALVFQTVSRSMITALLMWLMVKWKRVGVFSMTSFKELFSYGSKLLVSSLLATILSNINSLLIAKYIGAKDLGNYSRGIQFSDIVYSIFSSVMNSVLLPGLSTIQEQLELLVKHTRVIMKTTAVIVVPVFVGLSLLSDPLILVLLTDKWAMAIPVMQVFCISRLITVFSGVNINLLYVIGRTDLVLKQQYISISVRLVLLLSALPYGIVAIAWAELTATSIHFFINSYFPGKLIGYGAIKQLKDLAPVLLAAIIMCVFSYYMMVVIDNNLIELIVIPLLSAVVYLTLIRVFKVSELKELVERLRLFWKERKEN